MSFSNSKVYSKYGQILGLWRKNVTNYGGILQVTFDANTDRIIGTELLPPAYPNLFGQLRPIMTFCIEFDPQSDKFTHHCYSNVTAIPSPSLAPHSCEINILPPYGDFGNSGQVIEFRTKCADPVRHEQSLQSAIQEELGQNPNSSDAFRQMTEQRLSHLFMCMHSYGYTRLEWPISAPGIVLQPGLFKADFDEHGVEMLMLAYEDNWTKIKATKISGDPCVPFNEVAFEVNLLEPMVLNESQQGPLDSLRVAEILGGADGGPPRFDQLPSQPFRMPEEVEDCAYDTPNFCKARFFGLGQIAYEGFTDPVFVSGHFVVFNEDLIGFLYIELSSFTLMHRVQEKLV